MAESSPRPFAAALAIGIAAQVLFTIEIAQPAKLMFDEVYYVPAARALLALSGPENVEHPLLGKELIAAGIALFGDNSVGWRFPSALAATSVVVGVFGILWLLFGRVRTALTGAVFATLNFTVFVQARIAMLDGFMAAFVVTGIAALLWSMRAPPERVWRRWLLGSVLLGLAVAAKWTAVPYVAYAGAAFLAVRWRDARLGRATTHWRGLPAVPAVLALGSVSIATYFVTFAPAFFYAREPMTLARLLPFQLDMYARQTQVLAPHTYQSSWWSWPLDIRPIWYLYEPVDGVQRGVLMLGNPAVLWGGLVAVIACLHGGWRDRAPRLIAVAALWIAAYGIWIVIPKSIGFFYYYYLPSILLCLPLAAAFQHFQRPGGRHWDEGFALVALGLFCWFYPIISAAPLTGPQDFRHWMWLPTWP